MTPEEHKTQLAQDVKRVVADRLMIGGAAQADKLTPETTFESLDADSLDLAELFSALEEEFELNIPDDDAEKMYTVGDVTRYVQGAVVQS